MVRGSRDKLKQVFLNLLLNARDAMPRGGEVSIAARLGSGSVIVTVDDTGTGIPPEHLDRVFEPFFSTKKEVSGVGLGLSVTHGIVHQHGGTITVSSAVGAGTRFTITLPTGEPRHDSH
jgi:signal transduction histidine kinase